MLKHIKNKKKLISCSEKNFGWEDTKIGYNNYIINII